MHYFFRLLKYINPYLPYAILNVVFNVLSTLFSLVSLTMIIPFLGILFKTQEKVYSPQPLTLDPASIQENFYAIISTLIDEKGEIKALLFICILVVVSFFFRNLFQLLFYS